LDADILALLQQDELCDWPYGNSGDEVHIEGDKVVDAITSVSDTARAPEWQAKCAHRIDSWLEDGQDE